MTAPDLDASPRLPALGFGLGLRPDHYETILAAPQNNGRESLGIDWLEIISENYLVPGGKPRHYLKRIAERYPLVMHGVSLSIGSTDPLDWDYIKSLRALADDVQPKWISDHLCWTGYAGVNMHDLLPMAFTAEAVTHVAARIRQIQDFLGRRILMENVSSYVSFTEADMTEWEFLNAVAEEADCLILLDINNIYVSAFNHGFPADSYLNAINPDRVQQFHLAGHQHNETHIIDTHDHPVPGGVWSLFGKALDRFGPVTTMIERDADIPPLADLLEELTHARQLAAAHCPAVTAGA